MELLNLQHFSGQTTPATLLHCGWDHTSALFITRGRESTNGEYLFPSGLRQAPIAAFSVTEKRKSTRGPHHAVLRVQHERLLAVALKERNLHAKALAEVVVDHRPQLFVIPKQNHLEQTVDTSTVRVVVLVKASSNLKGYFYTDMCCFLFMLQLWQPQHVGHYIKVLSQTTGSFVPI